MKNQKYIGIVILMVIGAYFSWTFYFKQYVQQDTVNIHTFPTTVNGWESEEVEITEREYAVLETRNAFARNYKIGEGNYIQLFIVYSENNRKVSHPPEICYTGAGLFVLDKSPRTVDNGPNPLAVNQLLLERRNQQQISYYWFKVGDTLTSSYWMQQALIAVKSLLGQSSSSAMIRVSSVVNGRKNEDILKELDEFSRIITPLVFEYLP